MKKVAFITDSTCTLPDDFCEKHHIYKVPMNIIVNGESFRDGIDITTDEVFEKISSHSISTSQPALSDYITLYESLKEKYDMGISYHISSHLSGTLSSSIQAAGMVGFPLEGVDSLGGIHPMSAVLKEAVLHYEDKEDGGCSVTDIITFLENRSKDIRICATVGSMEQLHRSGRVKSTQALIGTLLNIKPIFHFVDGEIQVAEKVRSQKKAISRMLDFLKEDVEGLGVSYISIFHGDAIELANEVKEQIVSSLHIQDIEIHPVSPIVGTLTGKGTIGLTWVKNF